MEEGEGGGEVTLPMAPFHPLIDGDGDEEHRASSWGVLPGSSVEKYFRTELHEMWMPWPPEQLELSEFRPLYEMLVQKGKMDRAFKQIPQRMSRSNTPPTHDNDDDIPTRDEEVSP